MPYCRECGTEATPSESYCGTCGAAIVVPEEGVPDDGRDRFVAAALAVVFGSLGVHQFYVGRYKRAWLYLLFFWTGVPLLLGLYDAFRYVRADDAEFHREFVAAAREGSADGGTGRREGGAATDGVRQSDEPYLMEATGRNGAVLVYPDRVRIAREGWIANATEAFEGDLEIAIEEVASVWIQAPGKWMPGYIWIDEREILRRSDPALQENAVLFEAEEYEEFRRIRQFIEALRARGSGGEDEALEMLEKMYAAGTLEERGFHERRRALESG